MSDDVLGLGSPCKVALSQMHTDVGSVVMILSAVRPICLLVRVPLKELSCTSKQNTKHLRHTDAHTSA